MDRIRLQWKKPAWSTRSRVAVHNGHIYCVKAYRMGDGTLSYIMRRDGSGRSSPEIAFPTRAEAIIDAERYAYDLDGTED